MALPSSQRFIIRDGLTADIPACIALDHSGETDIVLQMRITQPDTTHWDITLQPERLPRKIDLPAAANAARLRAALAPEYCFLVATQTDADGAHLLAYLVMHPEVTDSAGIITDLVVSRPYRRGGIGTRLLNVARRWAREAEMTRLYLPIPTKNYPAIRFCQENGLVFCGFNDRYYPNGDIAVLFTQSVR